MGRLSSLGILLLVAVLNDLWSIFFCQFHLISQSRRLGPSPWTMQAYGSSLGQGNTPKRVEKTVRMGSQLSIPCELGAPGGSLRWLQNGKPVVLDARGPSKRRQWNVSREGIASLTITHVTRSDGGVWECQEIRPDGTPGNVAEVLHLSVAMSPEDPYLEVEGRRLVHQATLTIKEHNLVNVRCVVRGAVPPARSIGWTLGSQNLTSLSELFVEVDPSDDTFTSSSVLPLNLTREFHRKELICQVSHVTWLSSSAVSASINVLYAPSFSITREPGFGHPILEGMTVVLRCEVDANPPPAAPPRWFKQEASVEATNSNVLHFTSVRPEHAGWYHCATDHALGHFTSLAYFLNVRYEADLPQKSEPEEVKSSIDKTIQMFDCSSQGRPVVSAPVPNVQTLPEHSARFVGEFCAEPPADRVIWVVHQAALRPGQRHGRYHASNLLTLERENCYTAALSVRNVREGDAGEVLLVVTNARGSGDAIFNLNVSEPPVFPLLSTSIFPVPDLASSKERCPFLIAHLLFLIVIFSR